MGRDEWNVRRRTILVETIPADRVDPGEAASNIAPHREHVP
jgi:hypothetical protein